MNMENKVNRRIRQLGKGEKIPYDLLLLADETVEAINKYIFDCEIYVLERENRVIAEYVLERLNGDEVEIKNIAVAPDFQGQGIGKLLLRDAVDRAKGRRFKTIIIGTADASIKLLSFYQKEGFGAFGVKRNFFVDNYPQPIYEEGKQLLDMVMLKKELRP
jgi:ribosomal protein S18 acetylase RimI-like enzyme